MLALLLLACAPEPTDPTAAPPARPLDTGEAPVDLSGWIAAGEGVWVGTARQTPIGDLPFAIEMIRRPDGGLRGVAEDGSGFSLTFHYAQRDGGWVLTETGGLPGGFTQEAELVPTEVDGDRIVWVTPDDPGYLELVVVHTGDRMTLEARVRGEAHALLELARSGR